MVLEHTDNNHGTSATPQAGPGATRPLSLNDRVRSLRLPEQPKRRQHKSAWLPWTLCLLLAATSGGLAYVHFGVAAADIEHRGTEANTTLAAGSDARSMSSLPATAASSGDVVLERKGYVTPAHLILISPKVSGMIEQLYIEEGLRVKKGDVLAQVETIDYQADYDRARATVSSMWQKFTELYVGNRDQEIRQAKAELEEQEAQLQQLFLEYKRNTKLSTNSALAARDYEQATAAYRSMERRVEKNRQGYQLMLDGARQERIEGAWADVMQAEADMVKAKWRLDNCTIRAPVTGTILTKKAELGNLVNPIAMNGSFSLCEMADLSDIEVDLSIEERDVSRVFKGQKCKIRAEAYPERVYEGVVSRLMPTADRAKSAIPVRVKLHVPREEEGVYLKPDMGVVVSFLRKSDK